MSNVAIIVETFLRSLICMLIPGKRGQDVLKLRKELQALKRHVKKPQFTNSDRLLFVSLLRQRWCVSQRRLGRPPVDEKIRLLVIEMKRNNPHWGARRIKGELKKIGITLSKSSVCNILNDSNFPPSARKFDETWIPFLKSHAKRAFACDFIKVETAFLRRLYIFALLDINTREIVAARVTRNPTANWLDRFLLDYYGIRLYRTPPRSPNCNAFIERWNRTIREELLDRRIFFGRRDLQHVVDEYVAYYNERRPHQSLDLNAPIQKFDSKINFDSEKIRRNRIVDGLVLDYRLAA